MGDNASDLAIVVVHIAFGCTADLAETVIEVVVSGRSLRREKQGCCRQGDRYDDADNARGKKHEAR